MSRRFSSLIPRGVVALLQNLLALDIGAGTVRRRVGCNPYGCAAEARDDPRAEVRRQQHNGNCDGSNCDCGDPTGEFGSDERTRHTAASIPLPLPSPQAGEKRPPEKM